MTTRSADIDQLFTTLPEAERTRCEIWTRVMGYHRPVTSFNQGKQGEFLERRYFREAQPARRTTCRASAVPA